MPFTRRYYYSLQQILTQKAGDDVNDYNLDDDHRYTIAHDYDWDFLKIKIFELSQKTVSRFLKYLYWKLISCCYLSNKKRREVFQQKK